VKQKDGASETKKEEKKKEKKKSSGRKKGKGRSRLQVYQLQK
jgi:hypothetical protein